MSACLPGVSEPVRSAMPATSAPPIVAHDRTWREVMSPGDASRPSRSASHASWCLRPALRAEDRAHLGELVGRRGRRDVGRQADRQVVLERGHGGRPAVAHLDLDLRGERDVAAGVAGERPFLVGEVRGVDVGRVRVQQVHVAQRRDLHLRVAEAVHRDVDRDVEPELLGQLPVVADDVGLAEVRTAGGERHRDAAVVGVEVLLPDPPRVRPVRGQDAARVVRAEPPVDERRVPEAVGEDRSDLRLLQAADRLVGVGRRVHDVRPVDERRDARVDALERAPQVAGVHVVGPVVRRELVEDRPEVGDQREVRRARPDRRLPRVPMGVDEARDDDVAGRVDRARPVRGQVPADGRDLVVLDQDVGPGQFADLRVLGEDDPPLMSIRSVIDRSLVCDSVASVVVVKLVCAVGSLLIAARSSAALLAQVAGDAREVGVLPDRPSAARTTSRLTVAWGMAVPDAPASSPISRRSLAASASEKATGVDSGSTNAARL